MSYKNSAAILAGTTLAGTAMVPGAAVAQEFPEPAATVSPFMYHWGGLYIGAHVGGIWTGFDHDAVGECGPFRSLVGEDGTPIADTVDETFAGCLEGTADSDPDLGGPHSGETLAFFDLDDDYVAFTGHRSWSDDSSWLGGGQIGFLQQYGRIVLGFEGDLSAVHDISASQETTFDYFHSNDIFECDFNCLTDYEGTGTVRSSTDLEWLATIRGRVGAVFGTEGRLMGYVTGGVAIGSFDHSISGTFEQSGFAADRGWCGPQQRPDDCAFGGGSAGDDTEWGLVLGGGGEVAVTDRVRFGLEYLWINFDNDGRKSITFYGDDGRSFDVVHRDGIDDVHSVRVKLNVLLQPSGQ